MICNRLAINNNKKSGPASQLKHCSSVHDCHLSVRGEGGQDHLSWKDQLLEYWNLSSIAFPERSHLRPPFPEAPISLFAAWPVELRIQCERCPYIVQEGGHCYLHFTDKTTNSGKWNNCLSHTAGKGRNQCLNLGMSVMGFPGGSVGKESTCNAGGMGSIPGSGRSLEKEMAIHSSILTWEIPWTEEPGRLQSTGL